MKKEELYNAPKYAGIYYFKNNINGKYYIGQAVKLRTRLLHHMNNLEHDRYDAPLYRAFKKYGIENFSWGILDTFRDALSKEVKFKLDELEVKYIEEYNSYGKTGYNQTKGGDAGVLGLKQTEETKEKLKILGERQTREQTVEQESWIKAKNINTGEIYISTRECYLMRILKANSHIGINRCIKRKQYTLTTSLGTFIIAKYNEEFPSTKNNIRGRFIPKYSHKEVFKIFKDNPYIKYSEFNKIYPLIRSTFYYFRRLFKNGLLYG